MAKIRKRVVYRKNAIGTMFYKIFPDDSCIVCEIENLFNSGYISKMKKFGYFKKVKICRKSEYVKALREVKKLFKG